MRHIPVIAALLSAVLFHPHVDVGAATEDGRMRMVVLTSASAEAGVGTNHPSIPPEVLDENAALPPGVIGLEPDEDSTSEDKPKEKKNAPKILVLSQVQMQGPKNGTYLLMLPTQIVRIKEGNEARHQGLLSSSASTPARQVKGVFDASQNSSQVFVMPLGVKEEFFRNSVYRVQFQSTVVY